MKHEGVMCKLGLLVIDSPEDKEFIEETLLKKGFAIKGVEYFDKNDKPINRTMELWLRDEKF